MLRILSKKNQTSTLGQFQADILIQNKIKIKRQVYNKIDLLFYDFILCIRSEKAHIVMGLIKRWYSTTV